ncbi:MAG: TPM domain-containing protein [Saprospiraceae bacterium]|nr:TPM domain-containing protein [Saprospiraceae bacterium]
MDNNKLDFFTEIEEEDVILAIQNAEVDSSGQVRVHIENVCEGDANKRAKEVFDELGMQNTKLRNGVLFYLAVKNRKFAIIADDGINDAVEDDFWDGIKQLLLNYFRDERFSEGLAEGIVKAGEQLRKHFPSTSNAKNELPDEISYGLV